MSVFFAIIAVVCLLGMVAEHDAESARNFTAGMIISLVCTLLVYFKG